MKKSFLRLIIVGGLMFVGCKSKQVIPTESIKQQVLFDDKKFDPYFKGLGTEPFWNIAIDNNFIVYKNMEGALEVFPYSQSNSDTKYITASNLNHQITIELTKENCSDGMSDNTFDFKTKVLISGKSLQINEKGCGNYIIPKSLQGKWELSYFNGKGISDHKFLKTPYIEFENEAKKMSGNTSCNGINSTIDIEHDQIKFSKIAITKMMCIHENMESEFLKELPNINRYEIIKNELQLFSGKELKMKFRKVQ
ncbi:MAG TPA: META domain-containing protein [Flavobacterium sp.]|nr:META domain-containing protein [Flavobacterium sp.]